MRRFRPTFWPTLFTIPALAVLVALGIWQLQRLEWKDALIAERQARGAAPAIALPAEIDDPEALTFVRVRVRGTFLHEGEMYLVARPLGGRPGLHVVAGRMHRDPPDWHVEYVVDGTRLPRAPESVLDLEGYAGRTVPAEPKWLDRLQVLTAAEYAQQRTWNQDHKP